MTDAEDPWHVDGLDLDGYLARIGLPARPPSRAALDELHRAHVRTFTFDNIDVLLHQHPGVSLPVLVEKFVGRGRGGYCFEHATVFAAALARLGYGVQRRLGRVGDAAAAPRTHAVVVVRVDGEVLLADPGFGRSLLRPIPLVDGAEDADEGRTFRVRRVDAPDTGPGWELSRRAGDGWEVMHTTDDLPARPVDLVMGHHFTSTWPASHFTTGLILTRHGADGQHTAVTDSTVTIRRPGRPTEHRPLREGELGELLTALDVPVTADERRRLLEVVDGFRARVGVGG
jgi:N-hydroxyarylamine O-acetyltransferase